MKCPACKIQSSSLRYSIPLLKDAKPVVLDCGSRAYELFKQLEKQTGVETSKMELTIKSNPFEENKIRLSSNEQQFKLSFEGSPKVLKIEKLEKEYE